MTVKANKSAREGGVRGWEPPRGRPPAAGQWPPMLARDLGGLGNLERAVVSRHRGVVKQLVQLRYEHDPRVSLRNVAEGAGVPLSSVADLEAGSTWPSWRVIAGYAEAVSVHLLCGPTIFGERLPRSRRDPYALIEAVNGSSALGERVRAYHDLTCVMLTQVRTSFGISIRDLASATGLSPTTVDRIDLAPVKGSWVSYLTLAAVGELLGAPATLVADPPDA